jgi:hypothetical protein
MFLQGRKRSSYLKKVRAKRCFLPAYYDQPAFLPLTKQTTCSTFFSNNAPLLAVSFCHRQSGEPARSNMKRTDLLPNLSDNKEPVYSGFRLSQNELAPVGMPSFAEWVEAGRFIQNAERAVQFWIGDWLIYGEKTYGKAHYQQAIAETGLSYQTLRDYKWVASAVPAQLRTEKLGFHHHRQVADLPLETQARLLTQAQEEAWPLVKLKQEKFRLQRPVLPAATAAHPDLLLGDCVSLLETVPDASLDLLLTDPPYGIDYETEHREVNPFGKFKNDRLEDLLPLLDRVLALADRKLKNNTHLYLFTSWKTYPAILSVVKRYFTVSNLLVWIKNNWTAGDLDANYGQIHEFIIWPSSINGTKNGSGAKLVVTSSDTSRFQLGWFYLPCASLHYQYSRVEIEPERREKLNATCVFLDS